MIEKQIAGSGGPRDGQRDKASSRARKARLEEALRENLKRRKQQARDKKQAGKPPPKT